MYKGTEARGSMEPLRSRQSWAWLKPRGHVSGIREESEGWIVVVGFYNNIITNPAQNNGDSYYLLCSVCLTHITSIPTSPLRWVLLSSPLYRGQH